VVDGTCPPLPLKEEEEENMTPSLFPRFFLMTLLGAMDNIGNAKCKKCYN
jgi:hypothetical protein